LNNLKSLEDMGARGKYGFFEAVDFTPERIPKQKSFQIICSYMSHHQGMSLLSLTNLLQGQSMIERFHSDKRVQTLEMLLQERVPVRPKTLRHPAMFWTPKSKKSNRPETLVREFSLEGGPGSAPEIGLYTNGNMTT